MAGGADAVLAELLPAAAAPLDHGSQRWLPLCCWLARWSAVTGFTAGQLIL